MSVMAASLLSLSAPSHIDSLHHASSPERSSLPPTTFLPPTLSRPTWELRSTTLQQTPVFPSHTPCSCHLSQFSNTSFLSLSPSPSHFPPHVTLSHGFVPRSIASNAVQVGLPNEEEPSLAAGGGDGGEGHSGAGGSGRGSGGGGEGAGEGGSEGEEGDQYGPILDVAMVGEILAKEGVQLPIDMADYAKIRGIPAVLLSRYIALEGSWLGPFVRRIGPLRDRLLADPSFLFKVGTEVLIDSGCATFAEMKQRGEDFWKEFDLYASDVLVGIVLDVALVGMLAPAARFGGHVAAPKGLRAKLTQAFRALPNSMFEAALPGQKFSIGQRAATWFVKAGQYSVAGFSCGFVGQSLASSLIHLKRRFRKPEHGEEEVQVPATFQTALLWSAFMAVSSNTRYQVINGLERVVEGSLVARRVPLLAAAFTVAVRFGNNIFGGIQFVQWAKLSGVQ